jgi:hypothetical protein
MPEIGGLFACSDTLVESYTVNGVGELCIAIRINCQPQRILRIAIGAPFGIRGVHDPRVTTRFRRIEERKAALSGQVKEF